MARKKSASKKAAELAKKSGESSTEIENKQVKRIEEIKSSKTHNKKDIDDNNDDYEDDEELEIENKYKDSDDEDSEDEDEYGELLTEDVEEGLNKVLTAIKSGDKTLFDKNVRFFKDGQAAENKTESTEKKSKPIYLQEYQRMNLLSGTAFQDEDGEERDWEEGEKPFAVQQKEEKENLLSEINKQFGADGDDNDNDNDDEDDFLKKKEKPVKSKNQDDDNDDDDELPDPEQNSEEFLQQYLNKHAWVSKKKDEDEFKIEEDDEDFDDAAEKFENAYNFRYEDPNSAEIISYARNQATMRRDKSNVRKRQRDKKNEDKRVEEDKKQELLRKKKQKKINLVTERLNQIKEAVGSEVPEEVILRVFGDSLLQDDFNDADWDSKMAEIFDDQFYGTEETMKKPKWDDDDEIMKEFNEGNDDEDDSEDEEIVAENDDDDDEQEEKEEAEVEVKSKKAQKKEEKKAKKNEKGVLKETAEKLVQSKALELLDEVEEERGRKRGEDVKFKYRDVSPESFGLSTREILLADDKQLNELIGIKKFAPYREKAQRLKDKRKFAKNKRLREWRKTVFNDEEGPKIGEGETEDVIKIPSIVNDKHSHKHKKRKHDHKK
ncbi:hypothetical protein B5S28_g2426 [[Candida] boidinii]|nr:hypothetical protein B5S28_g2426 [[Candida] boidinii]